MRSMRGGYEVCLGSVSLNFGYIFFVEYSWCERNTFGCFSLLFGEFYLCYRLQE